MLLLLQAQEPRILVNQGKKSEFTRLRLLTKSVASLSPPQQMRPIQNTKSMHVWTSLWAFYKPLFIDTHLNTMTYIFPFHNHDRLYHEFN